MEDENIITGLEKVLREQADSFVSKLEEINKQRSEAFSPFQEYLEEETKKLIETPPSNRYFNDIITSLQEIEEKLTKGQQEYQTVLKNMHEIEQSAFGEYRAAVCEAFKGAFEQVFGQLRERNNMLSEISSHHSFEDVLQSLKDELEQLESVEEQMAALGDDNPVAQVYNLRKKEVAERLELLETKKSEATSPIYFPVYIEAWNKGQKIDYAVNAGVSELFEQALKTVLKDLGRNSPTIREGDFTHSVMTGTVNGGGIVPLLEEELEKPEYDGLRVANIIPKYFVIPSSTKQLLDWHEQAKKAAERKYTAKEVSEILGISPSTLDNILYIHRREILDQHTVKERNRRLITQSGLDAIKKYREKHSGSSTVSPIRHKKLTRNEKIIKMYREGMSLREIGEEFNITPSAAGYVLKTNGVFTKNRISKHFISLKDIKSAQFYGVPKFPKSQIRDNMFLQMIDCLDENQEVYYLGLEGPNFSSYIELADIMDVNPDKSLVAEHNRNAYNMMDSFVRNHDAIEGGEIFDGLNLYYGDLSNALDHHRDKKFNFVNLDYMGPFSKEKVETIRKLFQEKRFMEQSVLYITVSNHPRDIKKTELEKSLPEAVRDEVQKSGQHNAIKMLLDDFASMNDYIVTELSIQEYKCRKTPMMFMSYKVAKR
ncbi:hypothetical protein KY343_01820 [Candidatus Woesearchaeota archaeon]|nr:hypothetical protein [Candidatus Woesearchaeota archaeon]